MKKNPVTLDIIKKLPDILIIKRDMQTITQDNNPDIFYILGLQKRIIKALKNLMRMHKKNDISKY